VKNFNIVTLFPAFFESPLSCGLFGKARSQGIINTGITDIRDFSDSRYRRCDDTPYGGGSGMVLLAEPLFKCLDTLRTDTTTVILTSASGVPLTQSLVKELSAKEDFIIVCGHYEGVDQRFIDAHVDIEISIGDYVLSGGEYAALVIMDALARYEKGFMSNSESLVEESFENDLLEYPQYTRPAEFRGMKVPEVLTSGDHAKIRKWRREMSIEKTRRVRPDLYARYQKEHAHE
jgi:tRNA (guanine37-N1)-methyltransferase